MLTKKSILLLAFWKKLNESHFFVKLFTDSSWVFISSPRLKLPNNFSYLIDFGTSSHISGPNKERLVIPKYTLLYFVTN